MIPIILITIPINNINIKKLRKCGLRKPFLPETFPSGSEKLLGSTARRNCDYEQTLNVEIFSDPEGKVP